VGKRKSEKTPLSPDEQLRLGELISEFTNLLPNYEGSRLELGRVARELKPLFCRPGRHGGWSRFVTSLGKNLRTVDEWISDYEVSIGVRQPTENKRYNGKASRQKRNVAESATFPQAHVALSGKPFPDGKEIVEAVFVLTPAEKAQFIEALKEIGPEQAPGLMVEGLLREFNARREGQSRTVLTPILTPDGKPSRLLSLADEEPL
jgi:hypothetical protein